MPKVDDLVREARLDTVAGVTTVSRTFRVTGLVDAPYDILFAAVNFPGVPQINDQYPGPNNDDYRVRSVRAFPDGKSSDVLVVCTYSDQTGETWNQEKPAPGDDGLDVKQTTTTLGEFTTTQDIFDAAMVLNPPPSLAGEPSYNSTARVRKPIGVIRFERIETIPPAQRLRNMVGTVNSLLTGVYPAGSLLFTGLNSQNMDGGRRFRVNYEFAYSSQGWRHRDRYVGPDGKAPNDAPEVLFEVYQVFDFNTLGLDFTDNQTPIGAP